MNRLRDEVGSDPISQRGIEILRNAQGTADSAELRRRVWSSLLRTPANAAIGLRLPGLKALALGITTVAIAATAGAAIGGRWIGAGDRTSTPGSDRSSKAQHGRGTATRRMAVAPEATEIVQPPTSVVAAKLPLATAPQAGARTAQPAPSHRSPPAVASERTEVLDALIALRQDHDAERAGRLLDRYLTANRQGALREEALVLAIEAADARRDQTRAQAFARDYQIEFPAGRFAPFARHHLSPTVAPSH